jgi:hypothetical protein
MQCCDCGEAIPEGKALVCDDCSMGPFCLDCLNDHIGTFQHLDNLDEAHQSDLAEQDG